MYDDFDHHKSDMILVCGWNTERPPPPRTTTLPIVNHIANKHVTQPVRSNWITVLICLYPRAECRDTTGLVYGTRRGVRELYVYYNRPRNRPRALEGERQCYRWHRSKKPDECATREPKRAWITGGRRGPQIR